MNDAARQRERNRSPERARPDVVSETAPPYRPPARTITPELRLLVVGGRRIDVAAIGHFDAHERHAVASRLDRLVAGGSGCLRVDCSRIASIDGSVAGLFAGVRDRLASCGGSLELVDAPPELVRVMTESVPPSARSEQNSLRAVAS